MLLLILLFPLLTPPVASNHTTLHKGKPVYALSVETTRRTRVRSAPRMDAPVLGAVLEGTRFPLFARFAKTECPRGGHFIRIGRRMYGCSSYFTPSLGFPGGDKTPKLAPGQLVHQQFMKVLVPNTPAFATRASLASGKPERIMQPNAWLAFRRNFRNIGGRLYMLNEAGLMVPYDALDKRPPSSFAGKKLNETPAYVPGIVISYNGATRWRHPGTEPIGRLPWRYWLRLRPGAIVTRGSHRYFRTLSGEWVAESDIRRFLFSGAPTYLSAPAEPWVEVNLTEQTLVAYEGSTPRFITLMSSARKGFKTPTGAFRIFYKRGTQTLGHRKGRRWSHLFEDVPWVQFFKGTLAIHTAYWHDLFGNPYSMGCIELSPRDAAFLFQWTSPGLPRGFLSISQSDESPGTLLRIVRYPNQPVPYRARSRYLKKR